MLLEEKITSHSEKKICGVDFDLLILTDLQLDEFI